MTKILFIYLIIAIPFIGCIPRFSTSKSVDYSEPLINVYGKTMSRQYIEFLEKKDSVFKITLYGYNINLKKNKIAIWGGDARLYDLNSEYVNICRFETAESFKKKANKWNKKYYDAIDSSFRDMDNKRKIEVLNILIKLRCP